MWQLSKQTMDRPNAPLRFIYLLACMVAKYLSYDRIYMRDFTFTLCYQNHKNSSHPRSVVEALPLYKCRRCHR